jgi:citrate synthase
MSAVEGLKDRESVSQGADKFASSRALACPRSDLSFSARFTPRHRAFDLDFSTTPRNDIRIKNNISHSENLRSRRVPIGAAIPTFDKLAADGLRRKRTEFASNGGSGLKIGPESAAATAVSASNPRTIVVRGLDLVEDLIGQASFTDYVWLLVVGALPTKAQSAILDATLVAIAEHGLVPSVQAARMTLAAAPEAFQGAVAAGLLGCGSVILGATEAAGRYATEVLSLKSMSLTDAVRSVLASYRAEKRPVPGFGHPLHKDGDPRAKKLLEIAERSGIAGAYVEAMRETERQLPSVFGKALAMNVSAAIPAVLLDAGYPLLALKGVPLLARAAGLVGHLLEEMERPIGFHMSHAAAAAIRYDGPAPAGFVAEEN